MEALEFSTSAAAFELATLRGFLVDPDLGQQQHGVLLHRSGQ